MVVPLMYDWFATARHRKSPDAIPEAASGTCYKPAYEALASLTSPSISE